MILKKLTDGVYYFPYDEETDRPNLVYIEGEKRAMIVDAGNSPAHHRLLLEGIREIGGKAPSICAITHWHWDHTFGMCACDALTIAHRMTQAKLIEMENWAWDHASMRGRLKTGEEILFCHHHMLVEYDDPETIRVVRADLAFDGEMTIDLGGRTAKIMHIGGPHSDDSTVVYLPAEKMLFAGDIHSGDYYGLNGGYDRAKTHLLREKLEKIDFELYLHSHLDPMTRADFFEREMKAIEEGELA